MAGKIDSELELPNIPESLGEALDTALKNSAALEASQTSVDVSKLGMGAAKAGYWPKFDVEAKYNYEEDAGGVIGIRRDWSILLKASWTLFDGFSTYYGSRAARSNYSASLSQYDVAKKQIETDLAVSFQQLGTSIENKELMENGLRIAEEIVVARERMEKAGKETSINTLDAQSQLIDAKINYTLAKYDEILAAIRVVFNMGLLSPDDLINRTPK